MKLEKHGQKFIWSMALLSLSTLSQAGSNSYTSADTFVVPTDVSSVRVIAIGGGGAGAGSHYRGGGSGNLNAATLAVVEGASIAITVGAAGVSAGCAGNSCTGGNGGTSSFGALLSAAGGIGGGSAAGSGDGGSGGGGAGNAGFGGAGGSSGTDGVAGNSYPGGVGQGAGAWTTYLAVTSDSVSTAGAGGIPSTGSHQGGGGGGGLLIDGSGLAGENAGSTPGHTGAFGGVGYGAGGGSGGYDSGHGYAVGGDGAGGLVYVEWDDPVIVVVGGGGESAPTPVPTLSAYGLVLTMLSLLLLAGRRLRGIAKQD